MADEQQTLSLDEAGKSSTPAKDSSEELVGTVDSLLPTEPDETPPAEAQNTDKGSDEGETKPDQPSPSTEDGGESEDLTPMEGSEEGEGKDTEEGGDEPPSDGEDTRLDKHPRFKELVIQKNEFSERALRAEGRIEAMEKELENLRLTPTTKESGIKDYQDISEMDEEGLREKFDNDPKGFLANYGRQMRHEIMQEVDEKTESKSNEAAMEKTFGAFADSHPDFDPMWRSGEISRFMEKYPGHNAISAYHELTATKSDDAQKQAIKEAVDKAVKETEKRVVANVKVKGHADTLGAGPATKGGVVHGETAPELKEPKKFGGLTSVLASRLAARRRNPEA